MDNVFKGLGSLVKSFLSSRKFWSIVLGAVLNYQSKKHGWGIDPEIFSTGGVGLAGMIAAEDFASKLKKGRK